MIYLGADHGGYELKEKIKNWLEEWGYEYEDLGNTSFDEKDDYPAYAFKVAERVAKEDAGFTPEGETNKPWKDRPKGILACRSAAGVVIAANKMKNVRAFAAFDIVGAKHGREHNDANVLALSGDFLSEIAAREIVRVWLRTEFSGEERHIRRLKMIEEYEISRNNK